MRRNWAAFCNFFLLLGTGLMSASLTQAAGALVPANEKSSAALDFQIVVPPVLLLKESAMPLLPVDGGARVIVHQNVNIVSNLKRGFCMDILQIHSAAARWQVQLPHAAGAEIQKTADGYRTCFRQIGSIPVQLEHIFEFDPAPGAGPRQWPIQLSLNAL